MEVVLGRPHLLAPANPIQVFLGDGPHPLAAVFLLAQGQLVDDGVRLGLDFPVAAGVVPHGRRGEPMAQKMAPQLAGLGLPAAVNTLWEKGGGVAACLQVVVEQQVFRF